MNEDIQEGVVPQTIDYDNLDLPDPDAKQEDEQPESEEEQQIDVVNEETQVNSERTQECCWQALETKFSWIYVYVESTIKTYMQEGE